MEQIWNIIWEVYVYIYGMYKLTYMYVGLM